MTLSRAHADRGFLKEKKMKIATFFVALCALSVSAIAQTYVKPHVRKDGTYVEGHYRSKPDSNPYNNYSSQGNTNPYTGQSGSVNPYSTPSYQAPTYQAPSYGQQCGYTSTGRYVCR